MVFWGDADSDMWGGGTIPVLSLHCLPAVPQRLHQSLGMSEGSPWREAGTYSGPGAVSAHSWALACAGQEGVWIGYGVTQGAQTL